MKKALIITLFFFVTIGANSVWAQDKVVVIPLNKSSTPSGAAFDQANHATLLNNTISAIRTVTVNAPSAGVIIANASGYFDYNNIDGAHPICGITKDNTGNPADGIYIIGWNQDTGTKLVQFAGTKGFTISEAGEVTIRLNCRASETTTEVNDTSLTVMFFPKQL